SQIAAGRGHACHDLGDGGLLVGLAEMRIAGGTGGVLRIPARTSVPSHAVFYGQDQARYLIASGSGDDVVGAGRAAGVPALQLGYWGGASLTIDGLLSLPLAEIKRAHEEWLPAYMNAAE